MSRWLSCAVLLTVVALAVCGCGGSVEEGESTGETPPAADVPTVVARYPLDDASDVIDAGAVEFDAGVTSDGRGSVKVTADGPVTVRLFEMGDIDVEFANLSYRAMVRSEGLEGAAYIEMWCSFGELGEYFSRAVQTPAVGDSDWAAQETAFILQAGQNPDNVKLNLVVDGAGSVWIDDITVLVLDFAQ
jgi:hypothetical protein